MSGSDCTQLRICWLMSASEEFGLNCGRAPVWNNRGRSCAPWLRVRSALGRLSSARIEVTPWLTRSSPMNGSQCTCESNRPGMMNLPGSSMTWAPAGASAWAGNRPRMVLPSIRIARSRIGASAMPSMMVAPRITSVVGACCARPSVITSAKMQAAKSPRMARRSMRMLSSLNKSFCRTIVARIERQRNPGTTMQAVRLSPHAAGAPRGLQVSEILLGLDASRLDHLCPLRAVTLEDRAGLLQRGRHGNETEGVEALLHVGQRRRVADLAMKQRYNLCWRAGRHEQANPEIAFDLGKARLRHCGHIRQCREPLAGRDRERPQLTFLRL